VRRVQSYLHKIEGKFRLIEGEGREPSVLMTICNEFLLVIHIPKTREKQRSERYALIREEKKMSREGQKWKKRRILGRDEYSGVRSGEKGRKGL